MGGPPVISNDLAAAIAIDCAVLVLVSELKQSLTAPLIEVHKTH